MYHKPKVSIIIPCYNSEKYLERAVDSALNQSLTEIEIILIDDGSSDKTPTLLQHYKMADNRVHVFTHAKNKGLGAARNTAVDNATGDYLFFLDSDDYMHNNALEVMYEKSKTENLDILQVQHTIHQDNKTKICPQDLVPFSRPITGIDYFNEGIKIEPKACAKLWKTAFFKENELRFSEGYYEDTALVFYAFSIAERVNNSIFSAYHYIIREDSISNGRFTKKHIEDFKNSIVNLQSLFMNANISSKTSSFSASFALYLVNLSSMVLQKDNIGLQKEVHKFVTQMSSKYRHYIVSNNHLFVLKRYFIGFSPYLYAKLKKKMGR